MIFLFQLTVATRAICWRWTTLFSISPQRVLVNAPTCGPTADRRTGRRTSVICLVCTTTAHPTWPSVWSEEGTQTTTWPSIETTTSMIAMNAPREILTPAFLSCHQKRFLKTPNTLAVSNVEILHDFSFKKHGNLSRSKWRFQSFEVNESTDE